MGVAVLGNLANRPRRVLDGLNNGLVGRAALASKLILAGLFEGNGRELGMGRVLGRGP